MNNTKKTKGKNKLDEMQEQKMLKIEHNGCWLAFWGLIISLFTQVMIYGRAEWKYVAGEWVVFMCLALYIVIDCVRNGIWDRRIPPTPAANMGASIIAGIFVLVFNFAEAYKNYGKLLGAAATGVFMGAMTFGACFMALSAVTYIYRKRLKNLESEDSEENIADKDGSL